jgi:hypothetical protein
MIGGINNNEMNLKATDINKTEKISSHYNGVSITGETPVELIRYDKKTKIFIFICSFLFVFFVAFKLHNASIALWNSNVSDGASDRRGIIAGDPLAIRSDEWLVASPFILSQKKNHFPVTNEALGNGKIPLVMGLPANHVLSAIKPALWGYYLLDVERGFSWHWNFKIFPFLIAAFLFLMLFTRNNFIISVFGSCLLFLSSSIQWWSINTEEFTYGFLIVISFLYILYSSCTRIIIFNGIIFLLAAYSYAMILYPPYQVPMAYFMMALIMGFIISRTNFNLIWQKKWTKLFVLGLSMGLLLALVYLFFEECKETIQTVTNTVYPGKRSETGGNMSFLALFRDNFSWFLTQKSYPPQWENICELSSYMMLSPIVVLMITYSYIKTKKINYLFIPLLLFQLVIYVWLFWGLPEFLAKLSLFSLSPTKRTYFIFGFTNIVFTLLYLAQLKQPVAAHSGDNRKMAISFVIIFGVVLSLNYLINKKSTDAFFTKAQIFNATLFAAVLNWLILYFKERKIFQYLFYAVSISFVASNLFINPLSIGLSPFLKNKIYKTVAEIEEKDPGAKWLVFGHMTAPNFLKAAGINCFNGVQFAPHLEELKILDPTLQRKNIYNRYAHIMYYPFIDGKDSVDFNLIQPDFYHVKMDPCSPRLKQLGIKYIMFAYRPPEAEVRSLTFVKEIFGFFIYKRNDL